MDGSPHLCSATLSTIVSVPEQQNPSVSGSSEARRTRVDPPQIDPASLWAAMSQTKGVGVSITDAEGRLLFLNDTAMVLFSERTGIEYQGKYIRDFHSPEYVQERLAMIGRVLSEGKPLSMRHIYHGKQIHSTVWPIRLWWLIYSRCVASWPTRRTGWHGWHCCERHGAVWN